MRTRTTFLLGTIVLVSLGGAFSRASGGLGDRVTPAHAPAAERAIGPDVIVGDIFGRQRWGRLGDTTAFSVGTVSCNIGDVELQWQALTSFHPVIAQNMYRYHEGRFEQIGMSWLKHGFGALNENFCGNCQPTSGTTLGVGCSDPYTPSLNGFQLQLGPRSEVNPFTGRFPFPFGGGAVWWGTINRRLQVRNDDLDPALNSGAEYFVEGHYVTPDDAKAGNGFNNVSYRRIEVTGASPTFDIGYPGDPTVTQTPAIAAWQAIDPGVELVTLSVPADGEMTLGYRVTDLGNGTWHYEYALYNMNSDRGAWAFSVPVPPSVQLSNIGFHDVDYHSGEPFNGNDWKVLRKKERIVWGTTNFGRNPDGNALRWGSLYNFRFDADAPPVPAVLDVGLFKPGPQSRVMAPAQAPG